MPHRRSGARSARREGEWALAEKCAVVPGPRSGTRNLAASPTLRQSRLGQFRGSGSPLRCGRNDDERRKRNSELRRYPEKLSADLRRSGAAQRNPEPRHPRSDNLDSASAEVPALRFAAAGTTHDSQLCGAVALETLRRSGPRSGTRNLAASPTGYRPAAARRSARWRSTSRRLLTIETMITPTVTTDTSSALKALISGVTPRLTWL